jgi:hypothetical protein
MFDRLLFGTDYPLPVFAHPCLAALDWRGYREASTATNRFDRQERVLRSLNVSCAGKPPGRLAAAFPR